MSYRGKFFVVTISALITFYAFFSVVVGWFYAGAQQPINDPGAQIRIFESVLQHIQNDYVDEPNLEKVRLGAMRGLAYGLDPYSAYLTAEQVKDFQTKEKDNRVGIGAEFSELSAYLYVVSVIKGSPAEKAGLKAGDVIEYIEDRATRDISLYDAKQLIKGDAGTKVKLKVLRSRAKPQTISVTRGTFEMPKPTVGMKGSSIATIKVYTLEKGQAENIKSLIENLNKKGVKKIILDLRGVSTGTFEEGIAVANFFVKEGELLKIVGRENKVTNTFSAESAKHIFDGEVAVLINIGTAGAAEVIASSIIERKRGEVIGERSFGAGSDQKLFTLRGGDGFLLTTSKWASAGGKSFMANKRSESGIKPSIEVKVPQTPEPIEVEEMVENKDDEENPNQDEEKKPKVEKPKPAQEDLQMKKAIEVLQGKAKSATGSK